MTTTRQHRTRGHGLPRRHQTVHRLEVGAVGEQKRRQTSRRSPVDAFKFDSHRHACAGVFVLLFPVGAGFLLPLLLL